MKKLFILLTFLLGATSLIVPVQTSAQVSVNDRLLFEGVPELRITSTVPLSDMNRANYVNARFSLKNANGSNFAAQYLVDTGYCQVKGRGNTTWSYPKKPLAFVTKDSAYANKNFQLLGLPLEKDWVLLAEYSDKTHIRNIFTNKLGWILGMPWASRGMKVSVWYDGVWQGLYTFCEKVERSAARINIASVGSASTWPNISGGYTYAHEHPTLIEVNEKYFVDPYYGNTISFKVPDADEITDAQLAYAKAYHDTVMNAIKNVSLTDTNLGYRKYVDVKAMCRFFLQQEMSLNYDSYIASQYATKDRGGKYAPGPGWDWNGTWGANGFFPGDTLHGAYLADYRTKRLSLVGPYARLLTDSFFRAQLKATYLEHLPKIHQLIADVQPFVDRFYATGLVEADRALWTIPLTVPEWLPKANYQAEVDHMLNFTKSRYYYFTRDKKEGYQHIAPKPAN